MANWNDDLGSLPEVELPQVIVFLLCNGWSKSMVNNYKTSDGWKLHNDGHVNKVYYTINLHFIYDILKVRENNWSSDLLVQTAELARSFF